MLQFSSHILEIRHSKLNYWGLLDARFLKLTPKIFRNTKIKNFIEKFWFFSGWPRVKIKNVKPRGPLLFDCWSIKKISILHPKNSKRVAFLAMAYFSLPQCCRFLVHGCQNWDIDLNIRNWRSYRHYCHIF